MTPSDDSDSELLSMYAGGLSVAAIATELGMSRSTVLKILHEHDIDTRRKVKELDVDGIVADYQENKDIPSILSKYEISYAKLYAILEANNVPTRKIAATNANKARLDKAVQMYQDELPLWNIKQETGISQPSLHAALHERNIPLRRPRMV